MTTTSPYLPCPQQQLDAAAAAQSSIEPLAGGAPPDPQMGGQDRGSSHSTGEPLACQQHSFLVEEGVPKSARQSQSQLSSLPV